MGVAFLTRLAPDRAEVAKIRHADTGDTTVVGFTGTARHLKALVRLPTDEPRCPSD
ncbi:hypothetical protein AB0F30_32605 [Streptomyces sp. NPDC029006]|uniref:hypothetical protein n=1 Tax=Streptomyces sp. NPDC029006 TaxID=3155467 RepID=UPI0033D33EC6